MHVTLEEVLTWTGNKYVHSNKEIKKLLKQIKVSQDNNHNNINLLKINELQLILDKVLHR